MFFLHSEGELSAFSFGWGGPSRQEVEPQAVNVPLQAQWRPVLQQAKHFSKYSTLKQNCSLG